LSWPGRWGFLREGVHHITGAAGGHLVTSPPERLGTLGADLVGSTDKHKTALMAVFVITAGGNSGLWPCRIPRCGSPASSVFPSDIEL